MFNVCHFYFYIKPSILVWWWVTYLKLSYAKSKSSIDINKLYFWLFFLFSSIWSWFLGEEGLVNLAIYCFNKTFSANIFWNHYEHFRKSASAVTERRVPRCFTVFPGVLPCSRVFPEKHTFYKISKDEMMFVAVSWHLKSFYELKY